MTHCIAGYPNEAIMEDLVHAMATSGADLLEIQIPFSDPIADGPVILQANHRALHAGMTLERSLSLIRKLRSRVDTPILVMSYLNPVFVYGIDRFVGSMASMGVDGIIVPDCPPEEKGVDLCSLCNSMSIAWVPLVTVVTSPQRAKSITGQSDSPFLYAVLRRGVTGKETILDSATTAYLSMIKKSTGKYTAAGFGIKQASQMKALVNHADCGIVGSGILQCVNAAMEAGADPVEEVRKMVRRLNDV